METVKAYKVVNNVNGKLVSALAGNKEYWYDRMEGTQKTYDTEEFTVCKKNPMGVFKKLSDAQTFFRRENLPFGKGYVLNLEIWECEAVIINPRVKPFYYRGTSYASHVKLIKRV